MNYHARYTNANATLKEIKSSVWFMENSGITPSAESYDLLMKALHGFIDSYEATDKELEALEL